MGSLYKTSCVAIALFAWGMNLPAIAQDHGVDCATATAVGLNTDTSGTLTAGDNDFFAITAPSRGRLNAFTVGDANTFARFFAPDGTLLSDIAFVPGNFNMSLELNAAGTYCLQVYGETDTTTGPYSLHVDGDFTDDDHGTDCDSATALDTNAPPASGQLTVNNDTDFFRFRTRGPGLVNIMTTGPTALVGQLFDGDGEQLVRTDFSQGDNFLISRQLDVGEYCVEVSGVFEAVRGEYTLQVEGDFAEDEHGASCDSASAITDKHTSGKLTVFGDADFFQVQVPDRGAVLTAYLLGNSGATVNLYDANGEFLQTGSPMLANNRIEANLTGGEYCLEVTGGDVNAPDEYILFVDGDYTPANPLPRICDGHAVYDPIDATLTIPDVRIGNTCYAVKMHQRVGEPGLVFDTTEAEPASR